jgi:hypothetical protein
VIFRNFLPKRALYWHGARALEAGFSSLNFTRGRCSLNIEEMSGMICDQPVATQPKFKSAI